MVKEHINDFTRPLNEQQLLHLATCDICCEDKATFEQLSAAAADICYDIPPPMVFEKISNTMQKRTMNKQWNWQRSIGVAASIGFLVITIFSLSNHNSQQQQFAQLLVQNGALEVKLTQQPSGQFYYELLMQQLQEIENKLWAEKVLVNKICLLNKRKNHIQKMIQLQQGGHNEYYI